MRNEFKEKLIKRVYYDELNIFTATESTMMFKVAEHIETVKNTKSANSVVIRIDLEKDNSKNKTEGSWRVTQEKTLSAEETAKEKIYLRIISL